MTNTEQDTTGRKANRMVRVDLTDEEWQKLRIKAVQRNEPAQQLVSTVLRRAIEGWQP